MILVNRLPSPDSDVTEKLETGFWGRNHIRHKGSSRSRGVMVMVMDMDPLSLSDTMTSVLRVGMGAWGLCLITCIFLRLFCSLRRCSTATPCTRTSANAHSSTQQYAIMHALMQTIYPKCQDRLANIYAYRSADAGNVFSSGLTGIRQVVYRISNPSS